MFKATPFEFRFRYLIHVVIFVLGFMAPWSRLWHTEYHRTWEAFATVPYQQGWMSMYASTITMTAVGLFFLVAAAWLRTWGTAYIGVEVVNSAGMHGSAVVADGPYRHVRNPLYLGTWLHTLTLALMMEPLGAIFTVVAMALLQLRLILSEEPFLTAKLGPAYTEYCAHVPRLLPSPRAKVPASGRKPRIGYAVLGETYFIGVAASYAVLFAWKGTMLFPEHLLLLSQCILGSLGVSLIGDAFIKRPVAG
jgi:protein-S-isoprenylcysteine O-methyltransferase Ste14